MSTRPKTSVWTVSLLLGCLFSFLAFVETLTWRIDLTEDQRYTISPATLSLLGQLEDRLQVKLYFNEDIEGAEHLMPARKDLVNLLEEVARYSKGRMVLETVDPTVDLVAARDAEHVGVVPITVTDREVGGVSMESLYQGLEMRYQDRSEVIPFLVPGEFEFAFSVRLAALLRENRPVLGFFSREPALSPPMPGLPQKASPNRIFEKLRERLGSRYAIRDYRTASADAPFDRDLSALVVARPEEVTEEEQEQLTAYLQDGGNILIFMDHEVIDPSQGFTVTPLQTGMEEWLSLWGLKVHPHWVYDQQAQVLPVGEQFVTLPDGRRARNVITMPYGLFPMLTGDALSRGHVVTSELDRVAMMWAHPISYKQTVPGLSAENLLRSSEKSWALPPDVNVSMSRSNLELLQAMASTKGPPSRFALGTILSGAFAVGAKPGVLVVLGDADLFHNRSLPQGSENAIFGVNLLDWLSQEDELIALRTRGRRSRELRDFYQESIEIQGGLAGTDVENRVIDRRAQKARISAQRTMAWSNIFFPPLLILLAAFGHFAVRRSQSRVPFVRGEPR